MTVSDDVTATLRAQDHGHPPVICFEPGIVKREGGDSRFVQDLCGTHRAYMGDNQPAVCFQNTGKGYWNEGRTATTLRASTGAGVHESNLVLMERNECAICFQQNQLEEVRNMGEVAGALTAESGMHNTNYVVYPSCYAIEGNVVDRVSNKNGKGWCEDVSPTLNTQDRHAVCYALEGNGARPSHMGKGYSEDGTMYTLNTIEQHSVCYSVNCRNLYMNNELSGTLQAKNEGGHSLNFMNPVLVEEKHDEQ